MIVPLVDEEAGWIKTAPLSRCEAGWGSCVICYMAGLFVAFGNRLYGKENIFVDVA